MLTSTGGYTSFSVDDLAEAERFYRDTLSLNVVRHEQGLDIVFPGGGVVFVYEKPDHVPATYTALYLNVPDIDVAVGELAELGISLERYEGGYQDDRGVARGRSANRGPDIAWFLDPARNVVAIVH